ncbi:N-acetylmuramoyl-L-alanine amidase [Clostridium neonatale]|nr:N-acetylmuramoyl-L-alanine amidase [Clostridium neonatale]
MGSHCQGSNTGSLGICFEGIYMKETMPTAQYNAGIDLING